MEERKITNIKLIESGKVEVEITKTITEKVVLDRSQLLNLISGNQIKGSTNSKDEMFGGIKINPIRVTYDNKVGDKTLNVRKANTDSEITKEDLKEISKQLRDNINKHEKRRFVVNWI
ncbi:MAG: hypothetical protein E7H33_09885 [Clostridium perfringens]|nr:hypothetical protein [Clostridium perfringens]